MPADTRAMALIRRIADGELDSPLWTEAAAIVAEHDAQPAGTPQNATAPDGDVPVTLLPCPNPWCHPSGAFPPTLKWGGINAVYVECGSCGMEGPSSSPVLFNEDGEEVGAQDAEAEAITAWNTRLTTERRTGEAEAMREAAAALADHWRDTNKAAAAKARKRENRAHSLGLDHPGMAEMLDGAAIECNAIAHAIRALPLPTPDRAGEGEYVLPCDVRLPPATVIKAGCSLATLKLAMEQHYRPRHFTTPALADDSAVLRDVDKGGWIVGDALGKIWRTWDSVLGPIWTKDRDKAVRFHRYKDAEIACSDYVGYWTIEPYQKIASSGALPPSECIAALQWLTKQPRLSLYYYSPVYGDDDDQSVEWRVDQENGGINDRQWETVGRGETALDAILSARDALHPEPEGAPSVPANTPRPSSGETVEVPREPTEAMRDAYHAKRMAGGYAEDCMGAWDAWEVMLAAAPRPAVADGPRSLKAGDDAGGEG